MMSKRTDLVGFSRVPGVLAQQSRQGQHTILTTQLELWKFRLVREVCPVVGADW